MSERRGKRGVVAVVALVAVLCAGCSGEERQKAAPAPPKSAEWTSLGGALDASFREDHRLNQVFVGTEDPQVHDAAVFDTCKRATAFPATWTKSCRSTLRRALADGREIAVYSSNDDVALVYTAGRNGDLSVVVCRTSECRKVVCGEGEGGKMVGRVPVALRSLPCRDDGFAGKLGWSES